MRHSPGRPRPGLHRRRAGLAPLLLPLLACTLAGCAGAPGAFVLATTTSTENTGLLAYLLPGFEEARGVAVKVVAVGTGRALELGRSGDADAVLAHAPATERAYLRNGTYTLRAEVMYNQFLVVGPPDDPAGLRGAPDIAAAMRLLLDRRAPFVSRGDLSGTHLRERELWALAGVDYEREVLGAEGSWYRSVGQGMEATLRIASELRAYCLTDDGTFHAVQPPGLGVARANEPPLRNQYSVLVPWATPRPALAAAFADWLVEPGTQARIGAFEVRGHALFTPNAGVVERAAEGGGAGEA